MNQLQINEINGKIDSLHYKSHPCIKKEDLTKFETAAGVILPRDYRDFLLHIGNGLGWVDLNSLEKSLQVLRYLGGENHRSRKTIPT